MIPPLPYRQAQGFVSLLLGLSQPPSCVSSDPKHVCLTAIQTFDLVFGVQDNGLFGTLGQIEDEAIASLMCSVALFKVGPQL